jgi:hypothetical protein
MGNELCPFNRKCAEACKPKLRTATQLRRRGTQGETGYTLARDLGIFDRDIKGSACPAPVAVSLRATARGK